MVRGLATSPTDSKKRAVYIFFHFIQRTKFKIINHLGVQDKETKILAADNKRWDVQMNHQRLKEC